MKYLTQNFRRHSLAIVAIALIGAISGCVNLEPSQDTTVFYVFSAGVNEPADNITRRVAIRSVELADYLQSTQIVERLDDNQIIYHPGHRWGGDIDDMIAQVIANQIEISVEGVFATVGENGSADTLVDVQVLRFERTQNGVAVTVEWRVHDVASHDLIAEGRIAKEATGNTDSFKTCVTLLESTLRAAVKQVAAGL